jgi:hypothetical protein
VGLSHDGPDYESERALSGTFNAEPAPGPNPSADGLTFHEYELLLLSEDVADALEGHDEAERVVQAWRSLPDKAA